MADSQVVDARFVSDGGNQLLTARVRAATIPDKPVQLVKVSPDPAGVSLGTLVPDSLFVHAVDRFGNGVPGQVVRWTTNNNGSSSRDSTLTNGGGFAAVRWNIGTKNPPLPSLIATTSGFGTVTFTASPKAEMPASVILSPDTIRITTLGDAGAKPFVVTVFDRFANAVPEPIPTHDANGNVSSPWNLQVRGTVTPTSGESILYFRGTTVAAKFAGSEQMCAEITDAGLPNVRDCSLVIVTNQ